MPSATEEIYFQCVAVSVFLSILNSVLRERGRDIGSGKSMWREGRKGSKRQILRKTGRMRVKREKDTEGDRAHTHTP